MKKIIFILLASVLLAGQSIKAQTQPKDGDNLYYPYPYVPYTSFQQTFNTNDYANDFFSSTKDLCLHFRLMFPAKIRISTWVGSSPIKSSNLYLLKRATDSPVYYSSSSECNLIKQSSDSMSVDSLAVGTYYLIFEGKYQNGEMTISINASNIPPIGDNITKPFNVFPMNGSKLYDFYYSDSQTTAIFQNDYGTAANDVFYKLVIPDSIGTMDITASTCESDSDTYLSLLNASGQLIINNDDYTGVGYCTRSTKNAVIKKTLSPGTYYFVSEGYQYNGNIVTTITGTISSGTTENTNTTIAFSGNNKTKTYTPLIQTADATTLASKDCMQSIGYFDGLGRPIETVLKAYTPLSKDLVSSIVYDGVGRESQQWLPAPSENSDGSYIDVETFKETQLSFYADPKPFTQTNYEPSPLNRVTGQIGPGNVWHSNQKKDSALYTTNTLNEVRNFQVNTSDQLINEGYFDQASLYKLISIDADGKSTTEYKDKLGRVVMKRLGSDVYTAFVYNDLNQLCYVIPPKAYDLLSSNGTISDDHDALKKYGYLYKYDNRGNCIAKRLPGCGWIFMVYDKANRLLLSQNPNQRANTANRWTIHNYDSFGRLLYTAEMIGALDSYTQLNNYFKDHVITEEFSTGSLTNPMHDTGYSTNTFNTQVSNLLIVNYYDNYDFLNKLPQSVVDSLDFINNTDYDNQHTSAKGLLTGTRTYLLDGSGRYTVTAMYYDYRGQVVQTRSTNHLGGYDYTYTKYTFSGLVKRSLKVHSIPSQPPISELYLHDYDHAGRLIQTNYTLNNNPTPVVLSDMDFTGAYDESGRLRNKKRHNGTDAELFDYNIRNQPIRIKSGGFDQKLYYNTGIPSDVTPCYNGNIAYMTWKNSSPPATRAYKFSYDYLNRLTYANAFEGGSSPTTPIGYSEQFGYDKHGNINYLQRKSGTTLVDYFSFPEYNGNQLMSVFDYCGSQNQYSIKEYNNRNTSGYDFKYDSVGNMTKDLDRNIYTIRYNSLNLPDTIQFKDGHQIINLYDASGRKLSTRNYTILIRSEVPMVNSLQQGQVLDLNYNMDIIDETGTFYVDNIEYDFNGCDTGVYMLRNVYNTEGYANKFGVTGGPFYQYYRKDHLGNNREVWCANTNTTLQRTHYYPGGLPWRTTTGIGAGVQNRKYNDKEFVEMHGLDEYYSEARWYYPAIVRTTTMDPLAEKYYEMSPYSWCGNNPIILIDPDGREPNRAQSGTLDMFFAQFSDKSKFKNVQSIYSHLKDNSTTVIRYVYTEKEGWMDMNHIFSVLQNGKLATDMLEPASGNPIIRNLAFGGNGEKSFFSYEDLPSNRVGDEIGKGMKSEHSAYYTGDALTEYITKALTGKRATTLESAPNYNKIPAREDRDAVKDKFGYGRPLTESELKSGKYVPQNFTDKPFDLKNFPAAATSLEKQKP